MILVRGLTKLSIIGLGGNWGFVYGENCGFGVNCGFKKLLSEGTKGRGSQ